MTAPFRILTTTRRNLLNTTKGLTIEQINHIPAGFNNSIGWNLAHVLVTQQLLMYKLTANEFVIPGDLVDRFRKGTRPESDIASATWAQLRELLTHTVDQTQQDYEAGKLANFQEYETSFGAVLHNIEEAIEFNNIHEAMHLGYVMAMKHCL